MSSVTREGGDGVENAKSSGGGVQGGMSCIIEEPAKHERPINSVSCSTLIITAHETNTP